MLRCLLLEKLAVYALGHNFHHIIICCVLVETMPKGLAYDRAP
jgi:hypothetical protein